MPCLNAGNVPKKIFFELYRTPREGLEKETERAGMIVVTEQVENDVRPELAYVLPGLNTGAVTGTIAFKLG